MADQNTPLPGEIQRIASIVGELSLHCLPMVQHRATFPPWTEADRGPQVVAVPPQKLEGVYEEIWLRLNLHPEYQPLAEAEVALERAQSKLHARDTLLKRCQEVLTGARIDVEYKCTHSQTKIGRMNAADTQQKIDALLREIGGDNG